MSHNVHITALGMVSSLGHDVASSCAAARAELSRASEIKVVGQPFGKLTMEGPPPSYGHAVKDLGTGFSGAGKVLLLGAAALRDLLSQRPIEERERARTGLVLCLSDHALIDAHEAMLAAELGTTCPAPSLAWREKVKGLPAALLDQAGLSLPTPGRVLTDGSPGFVRALQEAAQELARGAVDRVLIGAVDSRIEPRFLRAAAGLGALRTNDQAAGLTGGEAAAFVLLERGRDLGKKPLATLSRVGFGREPAGDFAGAPATGRALSEALISVIGGSSGNTASPAFVFADLNGTERRAYEWGNTLVRLGAAGAGTDFETIYPAASFGDTGAAAGAVALSLAVRAFVRGYAPGPAAVAWVRSESGAAAAFGIEEVS